MKKNYSHNVIRLRKGRKTLEQIYWIVAILNKRKTKSLKIVYKLGYLLLGKKGKLVINFKKLAFFLNRGFIMKKSVKNLLSCVVQKKKNGKNL